MQPFPVLPTPAASAEIVAKEDSLTPQTEHTFNLPPSGFTKLACNKHAPALTSPVQLSYAPKKSARKRKASQTSLVPEHVSLPPPPSRSRKIIQVDPNGQNQGPSKKRVQDTDSSAAANQACSTADGKKKQTSSAGARRKVARKTAHSLIERRRRSKMNEEFGVLKDMIPACAGQEMHKLAILQASIDYMRYLESCLAEVKTGKASPDSTSSSTRPTRTKSACTTRPSSHSTFSDSRSECDSSAGGTSGQSSRLCSIGASVSTLISPAMSGMTASPAFSPHSGGQDLNRSSMSHFELPSPASGRAGCERTYAPYHAVAPATFSQGHSSQTSPKLLPQSSHSSAPSELDQEASAALLMLNASGQRASKSIESQAPKHTSKSRGLSVRDILNRQW